MNDERPYKNQSVKNLEQIFKSHNFNKKVLRALNAELKQRTTKSAQLLRGRIQAQLVEIRNREQFWRNKDAKEKAKKKIVNAKQHKEKTKLDSASILKNPIQHPKHEQGTLFDTADITHENGEQIQIIKSSEKIETNSNSHVVESKEVKQHEQILASQHTRRRYIFLATIFFIVSICIGLFIFYNMQKSSEQKNINNPYISLLNRGLSHNDVRFVLGPILLESGIDDSKIRIYFARYDPEFAKKHNIDGTGMDGTKEIDNIILHRIGTYEEQVKALLN